MWASSARAASCAAIATLLAASAAAADIPRVRDAEEKPAFTFPADVQGRPVVLRTMKARFEPNARMGSLHDGWLCNKTGEMAWNENVYKAVTPGFSRTFRAELEKAKYPVPKVADSVFDVPKDKEQDKPKLPGDLHVGLLIKEVAANFCKTGNEYQGGAYLKIFWQVLAPDAQKVVFETTTEGSWQPGNGEKAAGSVFFSKAFAMASRNLLADKGFYEAVVNTPVVDAKAGPQPGLELLKLAGGKPSAEPLSKNVTLLRSAVATIVADGGTGTGFFVSTNGYLLTNQHVVREAKFVKVKLATGRELLGEVVRSDRVRDVALVKTEPVGVQAIATRTSEANIGDEVFALGSPLGDQFNTTLTRGILSGYRTLEDKRFIQSDVAILPGNSGGPLLDTQGSAIGITVMGLGAKGMAGMNFFIPIGDALAKLGVELN